MSIIDGIASPLGAGGDDNIDDNDIDIKSMQVLRKTFIAELAKDGKFPTDPEDRQALMALMKDTTSSAIASKRIKADEKTAMSNASIVSNITEAVRIMAANKQAANRTRRGALRDVEVVEVKTVPGHTDVGVLPINTAAIANGSIDTTP